MRAFFIVQTLLIYDAIGRCEQARKPLQNNWCVIYNFVGLCLCLYQRCYCKRDFHCFFGSDCHGSLLHLCILNRIIHSKHKLTFSLYLFFRKQCCNRMHPSNNPQCFFAQIIIYSYSDLSCMITLISRTVCVNKMNFVFDFTHVRLVD